MPICHLLLGPEQGTHFAIAGADWKKDEGYACFFLTSLILLGRASPALDRGLAIARGWAGGGQYRAVARARGCMYVRDQTHSGRTAEEVDRGGRGKVVEQAMTT